MLKPFLEMICMGRCVFFCILLPRHFTYLCSPDVVQIQPGKKDFTVYVLDPLEARHISPAVALSPSPSPSSQPGVAIGLGLLSSALYDGDCDVTVAGTIMSDGIQEERLEVVFALREVCARSILADTHLLNSILVFSTHHSQSPALSSEGHFLVEYFISAKSVFWRNLKVTHGEPFLTSPANFYPSNAI